MATVDKNFRVKNGLVVEGTTGTIDNSDIITAAAIEAGAEENENISVTYDATEKKLVFVAENGVADSTTDDLEEGETNLYFTDDRAELAIANAIDAGTHENITITYDDETNSFSFVAENGVDDSTTDDLDEGETNLYFTDTRVREAISSGDGINYDESTGVFTAALGDGLGIAYDSVNVEVVTGNGLQIDNSGAVEIDTTITVDVDSAQTLSNKSLGTDLDADESQITNLGVPTETHHAATKAYVDAVAEGLHIHASVAAATDDKLADLVAGTATYDNAAGTITLSVALTTLDNVSLTNGMRILVKNEGEAGGTGAPANGIYTWATGGTVLTRAIDFNSPAEIAGGDFVFVTGGTKYNSSGWVQIDDVTAVGTDPIEWVQFSGAGTFTAGNGLTLSGTEFSIDTTTTVDVDTSQTLTNKTIDGAENTLTNIANESLVNDSVTVNEQEVALGSSITLVTDDVEEGYDPVNLYFTDQRAVDALEAVVPNFTAVEINSLTKQVATQTTLSAEGTVLSWAKAQYRSAKLLVKASHGTHTEISEVLLTLDTSDNVAITEYAIVSTNGSLIDITASITSTDVNILVTPENASTVVRVFGTLIA